MRRWLASQRFVLDAMRLIGGRPEFFVAAIFIFGEATLKPPDYGITFKREYVGCDPVEEPAVMGDDNGATRE